MRNRKDKPSINTTIENNEEERGDNDEKLHSDGGSNVSSRPKSPNNIFR